METMKEVNPPPDFGDTDSVSSGSNRARGSDVGHATEDFANRGAEAYAKTKEAVSTAYDKTTEVLNDTYARVVIYGRKNPGKAMLIAFGAGTGVGFLLAAGGRNRSRTPYFGEPVVNAVSQIASEFLRRR
jgi:hypothetical protein